MLKRNKTLYLQEEKIKYLANQISPFLQPWMWFVNECSNLFWSKYGPDVVPHTRAAGGAEDCAALSLRGLVGAGNAHSGRDDTVGLQDMDHFGILLKQNGTMKCWEL